MNTYKTTLSNDYDRNLDIWIEHNHSIAREYGNPCNGPGSASHDHKQYESNNNDDSDKSELSDNWSNESSSNSNNYSDTSSNTQYDEYNELLTKISSIPKIKTNDEIIKEIIDRQEILKTIETTTNEQNPSRNDRAKIMETSAIQDECSATNYSKDSYHIQAKIAYAVQTAIDNATLAAECVIDVANAFKHGYETFLEKGNDLYDVKREFMNDIHESAQNKSNRSIGLAWLRDEEYKEATQSQSITTNHNPSTQSKPKTVFKISFKESKKTSINNNQETPYENKPVFNFLPTNRQYYNASTYTASHTPKYKNTSTETNRITTHASHGAGFNFSKPSNSSNATGPSHHNFGIIHTTKI